MNDRQMKYMLTILREGSISRAAELLYVSQPSLSQMVRKVEEELGAELFVRHTTPMVLTPEGECYMQAARSIRSIQENLSRKLDEIRSGSRGEILLGIPVQRALEVVPRIFPWMQEHYPEVRIRLTETGSDSLESLLLNHRLDMACLTTSAKANPLNYILIAREQIMLLAGKHTAIAGRIPGGTEIDIAEAGTERFIPGTVPASQRTGYSLTGTCLLTSCLRRRALRSRSALSHRAGQSFCARRTILTYRRSSTGTA